MSTTNTTTVVIQSADLKGSSNIQYNATTLVQSAPIVLRWGGNSLNFNTISEFHAYVDEVIFPTVTKVFNTTGLGTGGSAALPNPYVASTSTLIN